MAAIASTPEARSQHAAYMREWRQRSLEQNREKERVYSQRKKERDPERYKAIARESARRYRENHPDKAKAASNAWKARQSPEYGREQAKKWREANLERHKEIASASYQKNKEARRVGIRNLKARRRGAPGAATLGQIRGRFAFHGNRCVYCGTTERLTVDHMIPLARGGTNWAANLAPACLSCNCSKQTKTYHEFREEN